MDDSHQAAGLLLTTTASVITLNYSVDPTQYNSSGAGNATNGNFSDAACNVLDDDEVVTSYKILIYSTLAFIIVGVVGNLFSICVFSSAEMKTISSNVYLLLLAISDNLYLISFLLSRIVAGLRCMFHPSLFLDMYHQTEFGCKLLQYFLDVFSDYSTCLILAFTVERCIAVYRPIKYKEACTVQRARRVCAAIFLIIAVVIAPVHFIAIGRYPNHNVCAVLEKNENLFFYFYIVEVSLFRIIPVFIIAVLNGFIIQKVSAVTKMRRQKKAVTRGAAASALSKKAARRQDKSLQLTIMLILVSITYILSYIPTLIHFVLSKLLNSHVINISYSVMSITQNYTMTLYVLGFALNFFLYTMSGRAFREQLLIILCYKDPRKMTSNGHTTYTECNDKTSAL